MKSLLKFMCLGLFIFMMTGCTSSNPESVAVNFIKAFYTGNSEEAKKYCTHESAQFVDLVMSMISTSIDDMKDTNPEVRVLNSDVDEEGNNAQVEVEIKNYYDAEEKIVSDEASTETVELTKIDDEWKVVMKK